VARDEKRAGPVPERLRGVRILLVEDDEAVRSVCTRILERSHFEVAACSRLEPALEELRDEDRPLGLVVTDMIFPGGSGLDVIEAARARDPDLPVLVITGYAERHAGGGGLPDDVRFLAKPFGPTTLLANVLDVLQAPED
jgi:two-component system cell cycle sensor histidine kinase/response regulator CckA